jgi:alkylation response protein AidB-like acyl-CoA dehydrogenase
MAIDIESFAILLDTVSRFVRERLVPAEDDVEERDVRLLRLYQGTTQIQQLIIGKHLMRDA